MFYVITKQRLSKLEESVLNLERENEILKKEIGYLKESKKILQKETK